VFIVSTGSNAIGGRITSTSGSVDRTRTCGPSPAEAEPIAEANSVGVATFFARAIPAERAIDPTVLLLDEPFSALDKNLRTSMPVELREIQRQLGVTTIFVTHDQSEALSLPIGWGDVGEADSPARHAAGTTAPI